jgi:hypothetical protein
MPTLDQIQSAKEAHASKVEMYGAFPSSPDDDTMTASLLIAERAVQAYADILGRVCWNDGTPVTVEQVVMLRRIVEGQ